MTFGTIHTYPNNPRVARSLIAALYTGVELATPEFAMGTANRTPEYLAKFPTGKVPSFENDDVKLFESIAIAWYVASQGDGKLLGQSREETAQVVQWALFFTNYLEGPVVEWTAPLFNYAPYNKATYTSAVQRTKSALEVLERALLTRTFLVGESATLADIIAASILSLAFRLILAPEHRKQFKNVVRYFKTVLALPHFHKVLGEPVLCEQETKYTPPKKEAPAKPAAEEEAPKEKKAKSKLDLLPPSSLNLEEWKRFYSNNDTKPTAIDWFWNNFDAEGYSIWRVDYKYNDELTKIFMSSNLIGGFFNRLERARKYAFGSLCVLGADDANEIGGYFVIRGQEIPEEVTDAADFESYNFVKVENLADEKFRSDFADHLAWEGDFGGKTFADAKVFK